jgi:hypothetical protein
MAAIWPRPAQTTLSEDLHPMLNSLLIGLLLLGVDDQAVRRE